MLIADGRRLLREGIARLLERYDDVAVVGDAADVEDAVRLIETDEIDVVLLNLSLPSHRGPALVREIVAARPRVRVVTVGSRDTARSVREIITAGAVGCLSKECTSDDLISAIRDAAIGRQHLSPELSRFLTNGTEEPGTGSAASLLSPRETQVLRAIASGKNTKEIAYGLRVARKTIETHRRRLMGKLERYSVAELTQFAIATGLIQIETLIAV